MRYAVNRDKMNFPGIDLERPGYFRQSLQDVIFLSPRRGRSNIAHCFSGGHQGRKSK